MMDDDDDDLPPLGTCCICETTDNVRNIVMLEIKNEVRGHGWGCVACKLPSDGASAVLCDACVDLWQGGSPLRLVCRGYPQTDGRIPYEQASKEPHEHDAEAHRLDDMEGPRYA